MKAKNVSGERFGRLVAVKRVGTTKHKGAVWRCVCDCGNEVDTPLINLRVGFKRSCGCLAAENHKRNADRSRTHGLHSHPVYAVYYGAKARCQNPNHSSWERYGGRGIEFRLPPFAEFWEIMGASWFEGASIDRIDNDGHYEIGNVRWATDAQQGFNRRNNVWIEFNGERKSLTQWAAQLDMHHRVLSNRLKKWSVEDALTKPIKGRNHVRTKRSGSDEQG